MTRSELQMYFVYGSTGIRVYHIREVWQQPRHGGRSRKLRFHTLTKAQSSEGILEAGEAIHSQGTLLPSNASPNEVAPLRPLICHQKPRAKCSNVSSLQGMSQFKPPHLDFHVWESAWLAESLPNMHSYTFVSSISSCLSLSRKEIKVGWH